MTGDAEVDLEPAGSGGTVEPAGSGGMVEPAGSGAADGVAVRRVHDFLVARGVSEEAVAQARADNVLHLLVADHLVLPAPSRYGLTELVERSGLDRTTLERLWRAMGFAAVGEDEKMFSDIDLEAVRATAAFVGAGLADMDEVVQVTRVVGSSMARIAEAEVASMPMLRNDADGLASADHLVSTEGLPLQTIARLLEYVWRRQMQAALRRAAAGRPSELGPHQGRIEELTVGFADLVGFTALAQQLSDAALAELVSRFEALAHDTVVSSGGRVVKMIGDEVMFVIDDPGRGVELALTLSEAYAHDELLSDIRVGVACGAVLAKDGDVYGKTVNMASRIVNVARPGSVVTSGRVQEQLAGDDRFEWKAIRNRYLKDIGRVDLHVAQRRAGGEASRLTERARRLGEQQMRSLLPDGVRERYEGRLGERG